MLSNIKATLKSLLSKYTPLYVKKSLINIWQENDDEFWLHCKIFFNGEKDLFRKRFLWSDLNLPLQEIRKRFGPNQPIFLLTDRTDISNTNDLRLIELAYLQNVDEKEIVVICAYESDEKLMQALHIISKRTNVFYYCPFRYLPTARYIHRNQLARKTLTNDLQLDLGKFDLADFENILQALEITKNVDGDFVEIGVYRGDSAHVALQYMKDANIKRKSYFFDLFEGFTNASSAQSSDAVWFGSHVDTSLQHVEQLLREYDNITVSKLDIITQDLPSTISKIALCNIDVDMYEAVLSALKKVAPLLNRGGIIILEDQGHTPFLAGAFAASIEFITTNHKNFVPVQMPSGQMLLIKL
jgi:hypothetical protein